VRTWPSVEPAIDLTSTGMLSFTLAAAPLTVGKIRSATARNRSGPSS
jgi:hypothetical protein